MKLIEILEERVSNKNYHKEVSKWLCDMAQTIIKEASAHLEYVRNTLVEFDKHNVYHSEEVLKIIEDLLGERAKELSSYDLFSLIAVSYLHDCGMAVSDFEINVMKIVECDKYDGKKLCTTNEAYQLIVENKKTIFKSERNESEVTNWLFYPGDEQKLIKYYSNLLIDYQNFRNGKIDSIKKSKNLEKTNNELRTDYIRLTHTDRAEIYVKTWNETKFAKFPNPPMGKRLAENIALACKAHGEDADKIRKFGKKVMYLGGETSNIQFIAMMLRIGDIVHYSYDRAPIVLRALHNFESDYSYEQWRNKSDSGVNYSISTDGEISFSAYCNVPKDYYNLQHYIDCIDNELILYKRIRNEERWDNSYPDIVKSRVNRDNIDHDSSFIPVPNLKFTLNQKKIIELLMGVGLYKDKYSCIRELYQNSLDACRCQISKDESLGRITKGRIEFGMDKEGEETYLYCLDNGKGMSKTIIENYLLKIGNSYYKSPDFYQEQAKSCFKFTPTSQFGIGILTCFMIGYKIEIVTKEDNGVLISCAINGPLEYFYYKTPSKADEELILGSGTFVKVFLKKEIIDELNCSEIENNDLLVLLDKPTGYSYYDYKVIDKLSTWKKSLFGIVNTFVVIVPKIIELYIKLDNGKKERVLSKPICKIDNLSSEDIRFIENIIISDYSHLSTFSLKNFINLVDCYILDFEDDKEMLQFRKSMLLPKQGIEQYKQDDYKFDTLFSANCLCIDGIFVDDSNKSSLFHEMCRNGIINFNGEKRPQISVDRTKIVDDITDKYDDTLKKVVLKVIEDAIKIAYSHISKNNIQHGCKLYDIVWQRVFKEFWFVSSLIIEAFTKMRSFDMKWNNLSIFLENNNKNMTIGEFIKCPEIKMSNYDYYKMDDVSRVIILNKFLQTEKITIDKDEVIFSGNRQQMDIVYPYEGFAYNSMVCISNYGNTFNEYDIITNLYPMVPDYLYNTQNPQQYF